MRKTAALMAILLALVTGFSFSQMMGPGPGGFGGWGGMMGGWWNSTPPGNAQALTIDHAWQSAGQYLKDFQNADLQLAGVMEFDNQSQAEVVEKSSGIHAFQVLANKWTGAVVPEPGPNLMWNTRYGHMGLGMIGVGKERRGEKHTQEEFQFSHGSRAGKVAKGSGRFKPHPKPAGVANGKTQDRPTALTTQVPSILLERRDERLRRDEVWQTTHSNKESL